MRSIENGTLILYILTVAIIALPNILWLNEHHSFTYFKFTYDEDYYFQLAKNNMPLGRIFSFLILKLLNLLFSNNFFLNLALDIGSLTILFILGNSILTKLNYRGNSKYLLMILLLFPFDILALANINFNSLLHISSLRNITHYNLDKIIPDTSVSFLILNRSPEPQLSLILLFVIFLVTLNLANLNASHRKGTILFLTLGLVSGISYSFIAIPISLFLSLYIFFVYCFEKKILLEPLAYFPAFILMFYINIHFFNSSNSPSFIFHSRLISLSPSVILSVAFIFIAIKQFRFLQKSSVRHISTLACCSIVMPIILLNQQLITGIMVSTRDWERYTNYYFLIFGLICFYSISKIQLNSKLTRLTSFLQLGLCGLLVIKLIDSQIKTFDDWVNQNKIALEACKLLRPELKEIQLHKLHLIVHQMDMQLIKQHCEDVPIYNIPTEHFLNAIPNLGDSNKLQKIHYYYINKLFNYAWALNLTKEQLKDILMTEISYKSGYHLNYIFSLQDSWYPITDSRNLNLLSISLLLEEILQKYNDKKSPTEKFLLITKNDVEVNLKDFVLKTKSPHLSLFISE